MPVAEIVRPLEYIILLPITGKRVCWSQSQGNGGGVGVGGGGSVGVTVGVTVGVGVTDGGINSKSIHSGLCPESVDLFCKKIPRNEIVYGDTFDIV